MDTLDPANPIVIAILNGSVSQARTAFDLLSGELHPSATSAFIDETRFMRRTMVGRIISGLADQAPDPGVYVDVKDPLMTSYQTERERFTVWTQAMGDWGQFDSDGNAGELKHSVGGVLIGVDGPVGDNWRMGVAAGYSHSSFDVDSRLSSGSSDNYHVMGYAGTQLNNIGLRFGVGHSWHAVETERTVEFGGFADRPTADYDAVDNVCLWRGRLQHGDQWHHLRAVRQCRLCSFGRRRLYRNRRAGGADQRWRNARRSLHHSWAQGGRRTSSLETPCWACMDWWVGSMLIKTWSRRRALHSQAATPSM